MLYAINVPIESISTSAFKSSRAATKAETNNHTQYYLVPNWYLVA